MCGSADELQRGAYWCAVARKKRVTRAGDGWAAQGRGKGAGRAKRSGPAGWKKEKKREIKRVMGWLREFEPKRGDKGFGIFGTRKT